MLALLDQTQEPITPAEETIAKQAVAKLTAVAEANQDIQVRVERPGADGEANIVVPLPAKIVRMMLHILEAMSEGKPVSVIPHEAELTTKQAGDFLNVSRPHVCTLIDEGKLPARLVGAPPAHQVRRPAEIRAAGSQASGRSAGAHARASGETRIE